MEKPILRQNGNYFCPDVQKPCTHFVGGGGSDEWELR